MPTEELIVAIRNKVYERYYLKHYFGEKFEINFNARKHEVETIDNYINQGGIFTMN